MALRSSYRMNQDKTRIRAVQSCTCLLFKRTSKERRKGNPPSSNNLSVYTLHQSPSNHSSCSDISSEYPTMILHTTSTTINNTTTPKHLTSQCLKPLPYHNKLYRNYITIFSRYLRVYPCLHLSVTLIPSISLILFVSTLQSITHNTSSDRYASGAMMNSNHL